MKKGDIVRKMMFAQGGLIGPYMRIEVLTTERAYCSILHNEDIPNVSYGRSILRVIPSVTLQLCDAKLQELWKNRNDEKLHIMHSITPTWRKVYEKIKAPKIIKFYSNEGNYYYFKLFSMRIKRLSNENVFVLELEKL
jgi:hypothetical protein